MIKTIHVVDSIFFDNLKDASACVIDTMQENEFSSLNQEPDNSYRVDIYEELID